MVFIKVSGTANPLMKMLTLLISVTVVTTCTTTNENSHKPKWFRRELFTNGDTWPVSLDHFYWSL